MIKGKNPSNFPGSMSFGAIKTWHGNIFVSVPNVCQCHACQGCSRKDAIILLQYPLLCTGKETGAHHFAKRLILSVSI